MAYLLHCRMYNLIIAGTHFVEMSFGIEGNSNNSISSEDIEGQILWNIALLISLGLVMAQVVKAMITTVTAAQKLVKMKMPKKGDQ